MNVFLTVAGIYLAGWVITFRLDAWYGITRQNKRRDVAIREATFPATWWPLAGLAMVALGIHGLLTAGLPQSQADRDETIAELEREALGDVMGDRMAEALRESRTPESRPDRRLVCVNCGVPLVPARVGFVHVPEGWYAPCDHAVPSSLSARRLAREDTEATDHLRTTSGALRARVWRRHLDEHHRRPFERCPECWPMLP